VEKTLDGKPEFKPSPPLIKVVNGLLVPAWNAHAMRRYKSATAANRIIVCAPFARAGATVDVADIGMDRRFPLIIRRARENQSVMFRDVAGYRNPTMEARIPG
jgi:hypothetical protein